MWWAGDWNKEGVMEIKECFEPGYHNIVVVGSEECCDGMMDCRFKRGDDTEFESCNHFDDYVGCDDVPCDKVTLYSDCCYGGDVHVVEGTDDDCLKFDPKSICIPNGV